MTARQDARNLLLCSLLPLHVAVVLFLKGDKLQHPVIPKKCVNLVSEDKILTQRQIKQYFQRNFIFLIDQVLGFGGLFYLGVLDYVTPPMADQTDVAIKVLGWDVAQHLSQHLLWKVIYAALGLHQVFAAA